jgi:benzoyl-CoA reductase/2-hydroxyglutaryl-CoA dehydratase subunit BcrC/BadD/HgdB
MGERIKTLTLTKEIGQFHYRQAKDAHGSGRHVAWVNAIFPVELLYAMDIVPVYPENHAVMISAKKMAVEVSRVAEGKNFSPDLCSYARCDLGSYYSGISPINGLPRPDFLLTTNAQCGTLTKWFEVLSQELQVPLILIDAPFPVDDLSEENSIRFVRRQLEELIQVLEEATGKSLSLKRLEEVLRISEETTAIWKETLLLSRTIPSPWTVFDQTIAMAPIVNCRGLPVALEFYRKLKDEIQERIERRMAAVPGESHRLFIGNLPIWHDLREFSGTFISHDVCVVASSYIRVWSDLSVGTVDPLGNWAERLVHFDLGIDGRADLIIEMVGDYSLDGFVLYSNRSCKIASFGAYDVLDIVRKKTGIPGLIFDADHGDPRRYSRMQVRSRLESYFELLDHLNEDA